MTASANENLKKEIVSALKKVNLHKIDPEALSQCVAAAATLQLSPETIATCWDAVSLSHNFQALNKHTFRALRQELTKHVDDDFVPPTSTSSVMVTRRDNSEAASSPDKAALSSSNNSAHVVVTPAKQAARRNSLSPKPPMNFAQTSARKKVKYEERKGVGTVVASFPPDAAAPVGTAPPSSTPRCTVSTAKFAETNVQQPYRHLFTTLPQQALALERRLQRWTRLMTESHAFGQGDLAALEAVGVPRQEKICNIGRICSSAHEGRMNATTVLLEGSRSTSGGARIEVDLRHLKQDYSLFPGQIVAIEGLNTTGRSLVAERLCDGAPHPANTSPAGELLRFHYQVQDGKPLHIVTAAGPFTTADNLDYQPLVDLLTKLMEQDPDVIILQGPFVDMRHPTVASGNTVVEGTVVPFEVVFAHKVSQMLEDFYEGTSHATQFILQPSLDDATAEWVFPQPPLQDRLAKAEASTLPGGKEFDLGTLGLSYVETTNRLDSNSHRRVHCVPNPCTLCINEVVVGITSNDVLFHTSSNETNGNLPAGSRLARIAQHMMQQRSYYPLFPGKVNLDWQQSWDMPCRPDVLVCPSILSPFAKSVLDSTLVLNPGPLVRDVTGGTYAVVHINPLPRETLEATGPQVALAHNVAQRSQVEVRRI